MVVDRISMYVYLTKSIAVCGKIGENNEDMLFELVSVVFCCGQRQTRSDDTFDTTKDDIKVRKTTSYMSNFKEGQLT